MNQPSIIISTDEELALVCRLLFYQPTGYHFNARSLYKDLKKEGYCFPYKKIQKWLYNKMSGKNMHYRQKIFHKLVMGKFHVQIVYISAISCFLLMTTTKIKNG